ncbi:MAG: hypothetical protein EGQ20_00305 [Bacteroides oleiciplenus]|nr:hypothetical protein [Bacteroides oleiciplenus]MBD9090962.1 hypothetical protein [Bacteroides oleiciplenus]
MRAADAYLQGGGGGGLRLPVGTDADGGGVEFLVLEEFLAVAGGEAGGEAGEGEETGGEAGRDACRDVCEAVEWVG